MSFNTKGLVTGFSSAGYWQTRYANGGTSGSGSRGVLADYKSGFLNWTFDRLGLQSAIDFGCGDGEQIASLGVRSYTGVDVSEAALELCHQKHAERPGWRFVRQSQPDEYQGMYDASLSLDVIFHLTEDDVFDVHMRQLFEHAAKAVIIYSSDWDECWHKRHVRHRWYSAWVARNALNWSLSERHANPYPYRADDPQNSTYASFSIFRPVE